CLCPPFGGGSRIDPRHSQRYETGGVMKSVVLMVAIAVFSSASLFSQAPPPQAPPPTDTVAPGIAGVVAAGTKVEVIKDGFQGTEGPIALPDGSLAFTETNA